jgi:hypothetical protein
MITGFWDRASCGLVEVAEVCSAYFFRMMEAVHSVTTHINIVLIINEKTSNLSDVLTSKRKLLHENIFT